MPAGLQVWNAAGELIVDITTRLPRLLGIYFVPAGPGGSITHPGILTGEPQCFCSMQDPGTATFPGDNLAPPPISFSGDTMTYGFCNAGQRFQIWVF
jgi:hypothetical protein